MDQLRGIQVFWAAVALGSLAAAGVLGLSAPMASKHLAALEAGLLHQCRQALSLIEAAAKQTLASAGTPQGLSHVSAPSWLVGSEIGELLAEHRRRHPAVVARNDDIQLAAVGARRQTEIEHPQQQLGPAQPHRRVVHAGRLAHDRPCCGLGFGLMRHHRRAKRGSATPANVSGQSLQAGNAHAQGTGGCFRPCRHRCQRA